MQKRCFVWHHLPHMLPGIFNGGPLSHAALRHSARMSAGHSLSFSPHEEQIAKENNNSNCNNNDKNVVPRAAEATSPVGSSIPCGSVQQRQSEALRTGERERESGTANCQWDLQHMLFSLKDHHTNVVSHTDAEERLRGMKLLDEWMITRLFRSNGWLRQLEENGERAPQHRRVVGEYKILRYLLHRFLSDDTLWRDELLELLRLVRRGSVGEESDAVSKNSCQLVVDCSSVLEGISGGDSDDDIVSPDALCSVLVGPGKMNFYSEGVQDVLWKFLHTQRDSFSDLDALWHAFVVRHRNEMLLASPHRPPFSCNDLIPSLTESEFSDVVCSGRTQKGEDQPDVVMRGVTLQWPPEWTPVETRSEESPTDETSDETVSVDDERLQRYVCDVLYMRLVEPDGEKMLANNDAASIISHKERGLLNPANGEVEDLQLSQLWSDFQKMRAEDIIDIYRAVWGGLERIQKDVLADIVGRKGLLLLFFARDEVRAVTPPSVTYRRLKSLHQELLLLMTLSTPASTSCRPMPPLSFEQVSFFSKLSYSCFSQLHAPVQRSLYCLNTAADSPAHLYQYYCERYPQFSIRGSGNLQHNAEQADGDVKPPPSSETQNLSQKPRFECLNELQQMALQFPFEDSTKPHGQNFSTMCSSDPRPPEGSLTDIVKKNGNPCQNDECKRAPVAVRCRVSSKGAEMPTALDIFQF